MWNISDYSITKSTYRPGWRSGGWQVTLERKKERQRVPLETGDAEPGFFFQRKNRSTHPWQVATLFLFHITKMQHIKEIWISWWLFLWHFALWSDWVTLNYEMNARTERRTRRPIEQAAALNLSKFSRCANSHRRRCCPTDSIDTTMVGNWNT